MDLLPRSGGDSCFTDLDFQTKKMDVKVVATLSGFNIPLFMKSEGVGPVLAGGVILTSATEVIGFVSILGLAT